MRLGQVVLVALVAVFACSFEMASANKNEAPSTTATVFRYLLSFADVEEKSTTKEERASTGVVPGSEGGRTGAGTTVVSGDNGNGGTITVTIYNNNGLWQRIKRWWLDLIHHEDRASSSVVAGGEGGRTGAGGTVVATDNGNGGGTVTVSIYNNNGLFQRVKKWWRNHITHTAADTRRLRQTE